MGVAGDSNCSTFDLRAYCNLRIICFDLDVETELCHDDLFPSLRAVGSSRMVGSTRRCNSKGWPAYSTAWHQRPGSIFDWGSSQDFIALSLTEDSLDHLVYTKNWAWLEPEIIVDLLTVYRGDCPLLWYRERYRVKIASRCQYSRCSSDQPLMWVLD